MRMRRSALVAAAAVVILSGGSGLTLAQSWPQKPIRMLVSDSPGGLADAVARIVANGMGEVLGQRVFIENRTGAASNIGAAIAAKAAPDGYTLYEVPQTLTVNATFYKNLSYDLLRDFLPVTRLGGSPAIATVHPSLPVKTIGDLVRLGKTKPRAITYASAGTGTPTFLSAELFKKSAGIDLMHVPYRGGGEAVTAVITGETQVYFAPPSAALPQVRAGRLRALAVTSLNRLSTLPGLPTVAESGYPGFECGFWWGFLVPANTPKEIIATLHAATVAALKQPDVARRLEEISFTPVGDTPEAFGAFIKAEIEKWGRIVRELGLSAD